MSNEAVLSPAASSVYHRAYELATELACTDPNLVARGHRMGLAEDRALNALLTHVLRRLIGSHPNDPALVLMAVRDVLENRRSASARSADVAPL
jgi:hypothetical protein